MIFIPKIDIRVESEEGRNIVYAVNDILRQLENELNRELIEVQYKAESSS